MRLGNARCNRLLEADTATVAEAKAQFKSRWGNARHLRTGLQPTRSWLSNGNNRDILEHYIVNKCKCIHACMPMSYAALIRIWQTCTRSIFSTRKRLVL